MSVLSDIFAGRSEIDFRPKWRISVVVSASIALISLILLFAVGLNRSIEFEGGSEWLVPVGEDITVADARDALPAALANARIQLIGGGEGTQIRVQADTEDVDDPAEISTILADLAGVSADDVTRSVVGPTWGDRITNQAVRALLWFFAAVMGYLAWRLEWRMAVGALVAVIHDLVITAGVYALFQFEVSPATVIALLTILGYSLYDTVVVFDKVLENQKALVGANLDDDELVSVSMNQVLMRSINTTITTVLPVLSMLIIGGVFLGGASLQGFALALFIGLILGTYSSIFVAAPVLVWLRSVQPEARRAAQVEARRKARAAASADGVEGNGVAEEDLAAEVTEDARLVSPGGAAPRPRKRGRRR